MFLNVQHHHLFIYNFTCLFTLMFYGVLFILEAFNFYYAFNIILFA